LKIAASVMTFHDTNPRDEIAATREKEMKKLIRILQEELNKGDAISVAETKYTPAAANRMKELLSKLGTSAYDASIKIVTDIGSATVKKMLDL
jgi:ribosome assembly protein YihI (activator of Der GTPase)